MRYALLEMTQWDSSFDGSLTTYDTLEEVKQVFENTLIDYITEREWIQAHLDENFEENAEKYGDATEYIKKLLKRQLKILKFKVQDEEDTYIIKVIDLDEDRRVYFSNC